MNALSKFMPSDWMSIQTPSSSWWGNPSWMNSLISENGSILFPSPIAVEKPGVMYNPTPQSLIIKNAPHRSIWKLTLPLGSAYLKSYKSRWPLMMPKAIRECKLCLRYRTTVPLPEPLLCGQDSIGNSYLLTREIADAISLERFVLENESTILTKRRIELIRNLAELYRKLASAKLYHADFHAGNVLIEPSTMKLHLLDAIELKKNRWFFPGDDYRHFLPLASWFLHHSRIVDRYRFFKLIVPDDDPVWKEIDEPRAKLHRDAEDFAWSYSQYVWMRRAGRCFSDNREFRHVRCEGSDAWVASSFDTSLLPRLLSNPDTPFSDAKSRILKQSRSSAVARVECITDQALVYKRFDALVSKDRLRRSLNRSPALHCHGMAYRLETASLSTARTLAVLHPAHSPHSYLIMEWVEGAVSLRQFVNELFGVGNLATGINTVSRYGTLLRTIAMEITKLHRYRLSHRDLKADNLLIRSEPDGSLRCFFIDLVGVWPHRWLKRNQKAKDLSRLLVSFLHMPGYTRTHAIRFLRWYLKEDFQSQWKTWWRIIQKQAMRKLERNQARSRPIG